MGNSPVPEVDIQQFASRAICTCSEAKTTVQKNLTTSGHLTLLIKSGYKSQLVVVLPTRGVGTPLQSSKITSLFSVESGT